MSELAARPDVSPDRPVILIVEDEVLVRMLIADVLQDAGYRIIEAANADEALRVLQARPDVHVVVTDVEMPPGPTGYDLAAQVRERWPYVQVLVSSGRVFPAQLRMVSRLSPSPGRPRAWPATTATAAGASRS